jgi:hypothetical protein
MESLAFPTIDPPSPPAFVTVTATQEVDPLVRAVRDAFQNAMVLRGTLDDEAFAVPGSAGRKLRLLLNNLVTELADPRFLEVGLRDASRLCPAIFLNQLRAVAIGEWAETAEARAAFVDCVTQFASELSQVEIVAGDFRAVDHGAIGPFNILYHDGVDEEETEEDQRTAMLLPMAAMDGRYVLIVGNWNAELVRGGTFGALRDAAAFIDYSVEIRTSFEGKPPAVRGSRSEWHNGVLIAVIARN